MTHYLQRELETLMREDPGIFSFIESSSLDGMWYWDLENPEHEWMSARFWECFGYDPTEKRHLASEWQEMIHPDDLELAMENFRRHSEDPDHPYDQTVRYRHRDGSTVWVQCRGRVIRDEDGKPIRMFGAHTDLTPLKRSEAQLARFVNALPGIALVLDDEGTYVSVKPTRQRPFAAESDDLVGRRVHEIVPPETSELVMRTIAKALETGDVQLVDYSLPVDGRTMWFEGRVVPYGVHPLSMRPTVLWVAHDVTERREAEAELIRRNQELQQFAYAAAHDLRSPIRGIEHVARWLEDDLEAGRVDECRKHLEVIIGRASRMQNLLGGLLDYAQTKRGAELQNVNVGEIVDEALQFAVGGRDDVGLVVEGKLPALRSDPLLLRQILQNLFGNAIKHHDGERVEVRVRCRRFAGGHALEVSDDGPGIPEEFHDRIFKMFQTLRPKDEVEATGLGLALVRKAAEELGGSVAIVPNEGRGTTFRVELPAV